MAAYWCKAMSSQIKSRSMVSSLQISTLSFPFTMKSDKNELTLLPRKERDQISLKDCETEWFSKFFEKLWRASFLWNDLGTFLAFSIEKRHKKMLKWCQTSTSYQGNIPNMIKKNFTKKRIISISKKKKSKSRMSFGTILSLKLELYY